LYTEQVVAVTNLKIIIMHNKSGNSFYFLKETVVIDKNKNKISQEISRR
jgi:hypothetical protein